MTFAIGWLVGLAMGSAATVAVLLGEADGAIEAERERAQGAYRRGWDAGKADSRQLARYNRLWGDIWPTSYVEAGDTPLCGTGEGWVN